MKIREAAKKYFEEELSGEPLCQDSVVDWLTEFAESQIKEGKKDIINEMAYMLDKEVMICSRCGAKASKHESGLCYDCWVLADENPMETGFYNTFRSQIEILPRLTIIYGDGQHSGFAIEWLWFGVFVKLKI